jgi:acid phosphatase
VQRTLRFFLGLMAIFSTCSALIAQQGSVTKPLGEFTESASAERLPNLDWFKHELRQYHECTCTCGCYTKDFDEQAARAQAFLAQRAALRKPDEKLAIVLDIDETTLSNWPEMSQQDFAYNSAAFDQWAQQAKATALEGTLRLYQQAQRLGVGVFFITGRPEGERAATERNLRAQGFDHWQGLTLRTAAQGSTATIEYKSAARKAVVAQGYTLVINAGDQWSDLRGAPEAELSVKYPNPFYFIP